MPDTPPTEWDALVEAAGRDLAAQARAAGYEVVPIAEIDRLRAIERQIHEPPARPVQVGDTVRGFCGGMFGRESYGDKFVEAVGPDWVVAREDNGDIVFCGSPGRDVAGQLAEYR